MSYTMANFIGDLNIRCNVWRNYPTKNAELTAIATALGTDTTKHDRTIEAPPIGLTPGHAANTAFTNDLNRIVNAGKGGGLSAATMGAQITAQITSILIPTITTAPAITGTATVGSTLTTTNGTWAQTPTSYIIHWQRNGVRISGTNSLTYVLQAADSGKGISTQISATNGAGTSNPAYSNIVSCA